MDQNQNPNTNAAWNDLQPKPTSGLAVTSLILGIVSFMGCWCFTAIPGIICGHMAMSQIKRGEAEGRGLAMAGLIIGYINLGLNLLLAIVYVLFFVFVAAAGTAGA